jgi:hypothetical protein
LGAEADLKRGAGGLGDAGARPADLRWLSPLPLWTGILAGPVAWALDLGISYAIVKWLCASQREAPLHLITLAALTIVAGGAVMSFLALQQTTGDVPTDVGTPRHRARFMAILGLTMCALFALQIVAGAIPKWMIDACQ